MSFPLAMFFLALIAAILAIAMTTTSWVVDFWCLLALGLIVAYLVEARDG